MDIVIKVFGGYPFQSSPTPRGGCDGPKYTQTTSLSHSNSAIVPGAGILPVEGGFRPLSNSARTPDVWPDRLRCACRRQNTRGPRISHRGRLPTTNV